MADYKTAEQYVVEKCEELEGKLEAAKIDHKLEMSKVQNELEKTRAELCEAYDLLNIFRDYIYVSKDNYFGNCIRTEVIYGKEHPEEVARIMEYFDAKPEEDK